MQSYSQKSQISQLLGSGQPKVLPKEQTERLKLVAAAVAAISAPPPGRTHTGTTKGGASSSGSGKDRIPDPRLALGSPPPRGAIPTMAFSLGAGGGSSSALPHGPGVGQADVPMADASPAPVAAAQQSALALADPSVVLPKTARARRSGAGPEPRPRDWPAPPHLTVRPLSQGQAVLVAVAADGPNPAVALPDTPSGSGIEVRAQLVICPWAECLRLDDRPFLDAAWKYLGAFDQEQVAYALLRLLKDSDVSDKPRFDRVRTGALAVLSATYRRLQAGEALKAPPAEEDAVDEEQDLGAPNFLVPLVAQIAVSLRAKAQAAVADDAPPDEKILKNILGGLRSKTGAQREQAARLYCAARRALPDGAGSANCCLAACLALIALKTLAEVRRLGLPQPSDWLKRYVLLLEETGAIFAGQIGPLVTQEREPEVAAVSTVVPSLKTESSPLMFLRSQSRSPCYSLDMRGWQHEDGLHQDDWRGVGLQAVPVHPDALSLPEPPRGEEGVKSACPATAGPKLAGNQCLNCSSKHIRGGCVNRLDKSKKGVAHLQGHLTSQETPTFAILWNLDGAPRREGDVGPTGFPLYLGTSPPPGRPLPDEYSFDRRPCELPISSPPVDLVPGSDASVAGADQGASEARGMWQAMVAARPSFAQRQVVGSKTHATFLASTVREQALPLAHRTLYPPTVAGSVAAHPKDAPELYCFYRFCIPGNRVPVQLLPWARPTGIKAACLPHPSWESAWFATAEGQTFFRLSEEEQAQVLADYDACPVLAPPPAAVPLPTIGATAQRPKRARAPDRLAGRKKPKPVEDPDSNSEGDAEDDSSLITNAAGLVHVIALNDPEDPDDPGVSVLHARDLEFEGSHPWAVSAQRPEVVLQTAMASDPLYAKAGVLDEGKPIDRNLTLPLA